MFLRSQPKPLNFNGRVTERFEPVPGEDGLPHDQTVYYLSLRFCSEPTLFRGVLDLNYMAKDGTWIRESREIGVVDNNWGDTGWEIYLENYAPESAMTFTQDLGEKVFDFDEATTLETIQVNAHGYSNP
jgi:hypothetical protein